MSKFVDFKSYMWKYNCVVEIPLTVELVANDVTMPLQPIAMTVNNQNSPSYEHEYYGYHNHMIQQQGRAHHNAAIAQS